MAHDQSQTNPLREVSDTAPREWLSIEHDGDTYLFDMGFLLSGWHCIFGNGCPGVLDDDATELQQGCCSHGAHFADAADRKRVAATAARLTSEEWQFIELADDQGGPIQKNADKEWTTLLHDGACIFLNRPEFDKGAGCALHLGALRDDETFVEWKPEVCWQVPLRLEHSTNELDHTTWTLREWKRRDWGEGGKDFHSWCTESDEAFGAQQPALVTLADEITALVGEEVYEQLVAAVLQRPTQTWLPHPVLRSPKRS